MGKLNIPPAKALWDLPLYVANAFNQPSTDPVPADILAARAYMMWEDAGRPDGLDFGFVAEAEIRALLTAGVSAQDIKTFFDQAQGGAYPLPADMRESLVSATPAPVLVGAGGGNGGNGGNGTMTTEQGDFLGMESRWIGAEANFMQGNNHSSDRQGKWDTSGGCGPSGGGRQTQRFLAPEAGGGQLPHWRGRPALHGRPGILRSLPLLDRIWGYSMPGGRRA